MVDWRRIFILPCFFLFALMASGQQATYSMSGSAIGTAILPDPAVTPGIIRTTDAQEICAPTFRTSKYRHTTATTKKKVYVEYGVQPNMGICKGGCEVDHLIPLELGGLDDIKDLWPQPSQPTPGFHEKDKLENFLRHHVCIEKDITLIYAQWALKTDWYQAYLRLYLGIEPQSAPVPVKDGERR